MSRSARLRLGLGAFALVASLICVISDLNKSSGGIEQRQRDNRRSSAAKLIEFSSEVSTQKDDGVTIATRELSRFDGGERIRVVGRVVEIGTGNPVDDADVQISVLLRGASSGKSESETHCTTDVFGEFSGDVVMSDIALLIRASCQSPGGWISMEERSVGRGDKEVEFQLVLVPIDCSLVGRVVDGVGNAISGAQVTLVGSAPVQCRGDGSYEMPAPSQLGWVHVTAQAPGFGEMSAPVRVEGSAGKLIPVPEIVLSEEAVVVGLIRSTSGVSIPGAVVRSFRSRRGGVTSDESGRYELRGLGVLGASDTVYVEAVGYAGAEASLSLVPGECRLDFELRPETVLRGQLVGAGGAPVKDVRVVAGFSVDAFDRREARSGSDGTFEIRGLSDGRQRLSTISKEWAPTVTEVEIPSGAVALDVGQLQLSYGRSIRGAVVDDAGDVVNDAVIEMFCGNDVLLDPVKTSADGTFELTGVPDCPVTLLASRPGYVRQICKLGAGAVASVSLVLTRAGTACGAVVDAATGLPATSFRLKLVDASSSEVVLASRDWFRFGKRFENVDGEWTLDGVEIEPGTYVGIEVETDDGRVGFLSSVELAPASLCRPNLIDVAAPLVVHGMVVDAADGARVKGAAIIVHSQVGVEDQSVLARCVTGVDGKFMVKIPHRGMFRLQVTAAHYESSGIEIDPERVRQLQEIVEIRLQKFGRVSGAVLNADGSPVVRCRVLLFKNGKHDGRRQVATDEYGRFVFESVAAGTWVVEANCDEGGTGSQVIRGGLRVEPAEDNWRELRYPGTAILKGEIVPIGECNVPIQIELSRIVSETEGMEGAVQLGTVVRAARDRSFEVRGLGEGAWIVRAIGIDPLLGSWGGNAEVELINGEECNTTIRLVLLRWHGKGR